MTYNNALLENVLQPRPVGAVPRCVKPAQFERGSLQDELVERAAAAVRSIYSAGQRRVSYDEQRPEHFFDACVDTFSVALEVEEAIEDGTTASIAAAIFERAGWTRDMLRPTTLEAQVRMQVEAVQAARQARQFFARQAALV